MINSKTEQAWSAACAAKLCSSHSHGVIDGAARAGPVADPRPVVQPGRVQVGAQRPAAERVAGPESEKKRIQHNCIGYDTLSLRSPGLKLEKNYNIIVSK